jgi:hypothetical protein
MSTATVTVTNTPSAPPAGAAAYASTLVTLTDSAGAVQTASLNGTETPPYTAVFNNVAAVAGSTGQVTAQAIDANGANAGPPASTTFTEIGSTGGNNFPLPTSIAVAMS